MFARSPIAILLACLWGYAEATRFWLLPDILLSWIGLNRVSSIAPAVLAATLGAILGGRAMHQNARYEHPRLTQVPGINNAMLLDAHRRFAAQGWAAVVRAPLDGIPYKIYATESAVVGRPLAELMAWTPFARAWRFVATAGAAGLIGTLFARSTQKHESRWFVATLGVWLLVYVRYFARLRNRYGP